MLHVFVGLTGADHHAVHSPEEKPYPYLNIRRKVSP
jgi:hypothetical protein